MRNPLYFIPVILILFFYTLYKMRKLFPNKKLLAVSLVFLILALAVSSQFVYRALASSNDGIAHSLPVSTLLWVGGFLMGLLATLWVLSLPLDLLGLLQNAFRFFSKKDGLPTDPERRLLLSRGLTMTVFAGSTGMAAVGLAESILGPDVKEIPILIPGLHPDLQKFRIAQISDLHVGPTVRKDYVTKVVQKVMELKPDLIAVTGDLADGRPDQLQDDLAPLAALKSAHGVFYVTGNHEYYWGVNSWIQKAKDLGFTPLLNENVILSVGSAKLLLGGVTDTGAAQFDPSHESDPHKAAATTETSHLKILMAHRPESCEEASAAGFDFQLSGHTHAGQFFPFNILVSLAHKYFRGLYKHEKMWLYVNSGTGYWGPPNRFAVPPEITLFQLKSQEEAQS